MLKKHIVSVISVKILIFNDYVYMLKTVYMTIDVLLFVFIRFSAILHYINIQIACSTCINIHPMSYQNRPSLLSNFILIFE